MYPYNHKMGQRIRSDIPGVALDRSFLAHYHIDAEDAVESSSDGVHAAMNLGAEAQAITTGITSPAVPRNIRIDGNVPGITGKVKITGTNFAGEVITEEIQADGTTAKDGALAFKSVTKIDLPTQNHTPAAQVETATAAGTVATAGRAKCEVTCAGMPGSPLHVPFGVDLNDDAVAIAAALRAALVDMESELVGPVITAWFDVSGEGASVVLTRKTPATNDDTLNIAISDGEGEGASVGVTTAATSTTTTPGVPYDQISVGWGDKFGLPYKLYADELVILKLFNKAKESTEGTVTADATYLEKNVYDPNDTSLGVDIDLYIIV